MIRVRFPTGLTVTYNDANNLFRDGDAWELYHRTTNAQGQTTKRTWIASIQASSGAIIEAVPPCRVERQPDLESPEAALRLVLTHAREIRDTRRLAELKRALDLFDALEYIQRRFAS